MKTITGFCLLLFLLIGCSTNVVEQATPPPFEPDQVELELDPNSADDLGFDSDMLAQIPAYIDDGFSHLFSVLVLRRGELAYEWYADSQDVDTPAVVWSVTKSFSSALVGIAIDEGLLNSVDQTLGELIPLELPIDGDPRTADITLRQLLTMTSGISCTNDRCHDSTIAESAKRELRADPGTAFVYDTGASHLLSAVLEEVTGMSIYDYAEQKLFDPLAFEGESWETDADGTHFGGKGLHIRPRDMAKFGQLFLNQGEWNGTQLISAEYVQTATADRLAGIPGGGEYGYLWWPGEVGGHDAYAAVGYGGQYITVVPDLDLVVVITSSFWRQHENNDAIIEDLIVPALAE